MELSLFPLSYSFASRCYRNLTSVGASAIISSQSIVYREQNDRSNDSSSYSLSAQVQSLLWNLFPMQSFHPWMESYKKELKINKYCYCGLYQLQKKKKEERKYSFRSWLCLAYSNTYFQAISIPAPLNFPLFIKMANKKKSIPKLKIKSQKERFH